MYPLHIMHKVSQEKRNLSVGQAHPCFEQENCLERVSQLENYQLLTERCIVYTSVVPPYQY